MLTVYLGKKKESIFYISQIFNSEYRDEWFENDTVKRMVLDVDKSKVIAPRIIDSPILGLITPKELSTGVKALILMLCDPDKEGIFFDGNFLGDNCVNWLYEISKTKDIRITLTNLMDFERIDDEDDFNIYIENDGRYVKSSYEFLMAYIDHKDERLGIEKEVIISDRSGCIQNMITPFNDITKTESNVEQYQLLLKDIVITDFSISNHNILDCSIIEDKEHLLPYHLKQGNKAVGLNNFLLNRHIDFTRSNARVLLKKLGLRPTKSIMNVIDNYSLSLIDSYWTRPTNQNITYKDVNLYDKIHKDFIVDTSLSGIETEVHKFEPNPELTNIGSFNKSWIFKDNEWRLYKKGTAYNYYVEFLYYKLSNLLNIPCAHYQYDKDLQMLYSVNITNKSYQLEHWDSIHNFQTNLDTSIIDSLNNMNALDAITYNYDRHEFNYGVIRSTDTGEIIEQAKLFDHNLCLGVGGDGFNDGPLGLGMLKMNIDNSHNPTYCKMLKITEAQIINMDKEVKIQIQQENLDTTRQVKHLIEIIEYLKSHNSNGIK